ncbi:MAG TPA: hypothetical protein VNT55_25320 [Baekduia sp.]|nr:hypothetical protein [Baekduia sp.]
MRLPVPTPGSDHHRAVALRRTDERRLGASLADALRAAVVAAEAVVQAVVRGGPSAPAAQRAPAPAASVSSDERARRRPAVEHETLVYELLDAHADTADLAAELVSEPLWAAHLDYLRALQRKGRQTLAQTSDEDR